MKFARIEELEKFIRQNELFVGFKSMSEIYKGGSSYNFKIITDKGTYLLKLLDHIGNYNRMRFMLEYLGENRALNLDEFDGYKLVAMPYYNAVKLRYNRLNSAVLKNLSDKYHQVFGAHLASDNVRPQIMMDNLQKEINEKISVSKNIGERLCMILFWNRIKNNLVKFPQTDNVIHGDFSQNNILISADNKIHLIDFDAIRYGYEIEDFAHNIMQICRFSSLFGSMKKFKKIYFMINEINGNYSASMWLYGIQIFYLLSLLRWLDLTSNKKKGLYKSLCRIAGLCNYFRIEKFLKTK
ncbi:MAG: phosphotransferase [Alphaproteobacteria bacterium]|nr:phosphotransferase [Alphaproteobacteria bacterium]